MRNWITLLENASFVPDLTHFISSDLVDEIIRTNKWVDHGAELDDWLDGSFYATDNYTEIGISLEQAENLQNIPHNEAIKLPEFRKCVEHWVNFRIRDIQKSFENGVKFDNIPPLTGESILTRVIRAAEPVFPLGVYWTTHNAQSIARVAPDHEKDPIIVMQVKAKNVTIDWYQTVRSRLDYSNGSYEEEVHLVKGSTASNVRYGKIMYRGGYFNMNLIKWNPELISGVV